VGYADVANFPAHVALGTDGIGSDLFAELQAGWFRAQEGKVPWTPSRWLSVLSSGATLAGAALGVRLGRIEAGCEADLTVLDPVPGPPLTQDNLAAAFLFRLSSSAVRDVMVAGQWRLKERMPCGIDACELDQRAQREAVSLWERMRG
jgi:cytosine/adenosine deaminase-related metal-dependent hydrolase